MREGGGSLNKQTDVFSNKKKQQNVRNMVQKKCQKEQFDYFGKVRLKCQKNIGKMMLVMTRKEN